MRRPPVGRLRIGILLIGLGALLAIPLLGIHGAMADNDDDDIAAELSGSGGKAAMVAFDAAPFPYDGMVPGDPDANTDDAPFLDAEEGGRRGHTSNRGGIYWENETYSERRT